MRERILRVKYCEEQCSYAENESCLSLWQHGLSRCHLCVVKEVTEDWICDDCDRRFDKFVEYFELCEAPQMEPRDDTLPTFVMIRKLCEDCYGKRTEKTESEQGG